MSKRLKVYSHPRSGTHFLEAFLARNFYPDQDLSQKEVLWGHWSNREINHKGNPYGLLFGSHKFPSDWLLNGKENEIIYIYRDGRAVATSIYKTRNFLHRRLESLSFSEFLRHKLDWHGSLGDQVEPQLTIAEHWYQHVSEWTEAAKKRRILAIRYEDLMHNPETVYRRICRRHFPLKSLKNRFISPEIDPVKEPTGLLPNAARIDAWKDFFSEEDENYFMSLIPSNQFLYKT